MMEELYKVVKQKLEDELSLLEDKPEETIDSTIKALWYKAIGTALSAEKASVLPLVKLSDHQKIAFQQLLNIRLGGLPLAYLTERQTFMGIDFLSDKRALIPRKETEILGKAALELCHKIAERKSIINVFDVCCGSGNLGLALAYLNQNTQIHSSDLSDEAVELTYENILFLDLNRRVKVLQSDLFSNFESTDFWGKIELIVCNPPYISTSKVSKMTPEIAANEPAIAFDGGIVGLKIIQRLIQESPKFLSEEGWLIFEVGVGQGPFALHICEKSGLYKLITSVADNLGNIRVIAACKKNN